MDANDPKVVGRAHPKRSRLSLDGWPLRWKVAATLVVPVVLAATFGAVRIQSELAAASELSVAADNTTIVGPAVRFLDRLDGLAAAAAAGPPAAESLAAFDESASELQALIRSGDFAPRVTAELATASATAATVRDELAAGAPPGLVMAERMDGVASNVAAAVATSTAAVDDAAVRPIADRLTTVLAAQRALTTQRILASSPEFAASVELRTSAAEAAGAEAAAIERLYQLNPDADAVTLREQSDARRAAYIRPLGEAVLSADLDSTMRGSAERYWALGQRLSADLQSAVEARSTALRSAALRDTAIILGAVLAALFFALGIGRSLIGSIGRLRRGALRVAQVQLPQEIEQLSRGAGVPEITALPVDTDEEVGQLARAIDDIHLQAVKLASEHGVRLQIGDMFETLSRRSRSLVEEQLVLIETLEHDEDDPARLDHLFRLDHLATRMRRNGDNLLVLADTVERHRRPEPVPVHEMLRAAISEVEDYRRVTLGPVVEGAVAGAAAADIGHMLAELLDNALQYSPPDSPVWVTVSRAADAGLLVEIADRGLGMAADDMREANERLAIGGEVTSDTAKRMGLFVVGRLARRHGATVVLRTPAGVTHQPGVTVSVHLPGSLLALRPDMTTRGIDADAAAPAPLPAPPVRPVEQVNGRNGERTATPPPPNVPDAVPTAAGLPRRSPGASGVPGVAPAAASQPPPPPPPPVEPAWPAPDTDDGSIYARMTSEWTTPPPPPSAPPPSAPGAEPERVVQAQRRTTRSGLPIRERGARLIPERADDTEPDTATDVVDGARTGTRTDPEAIRAVLSRQLTGVRRGRAEADEANRRGDEER